MKGLKCLSDIEHFEKSASKEICEVVVIQLEADSLMYWRHVRRAGTSL